MAEALIPLPFGAKQLGSVASCPGNPSAPLQVILPGRAYELTDPRTEHQGLEIGIPWEL